MTVLLTHDDHDWSLDPDLLTLIDEKEDLMLFDECLEPLCARCYSEGPLFSANCEEKPELLINTPLGMYHCPDCGAMIVAGMPHFELCKLCLDRKHPSYDA